RIVSCGYGLSQHFGVVVLTMALCGLWQGSGWYFVLWGALQGVAMAFAALWSRHLPASPALIGWAATIIFFVTTLVFFRSPNLDYAFNYLGTMLSFGGGWPAAVDDAAPAWEVAAGGAALFALHLVQFRLPKTPLLPVLSPPPG